MPTYQLDRDGRLLADGQAVLRDLDAAWALLPDAAGAGVFLRASAPVPAASLRFTLGRFAGLRRFTSCYRPDPWWLEPKTGSEERDVLPETEFLLGELQGSRYLLLLALVDGGFRVALQGEPGDGVLLALAESNDPETLGVAVTALYLAAGDEPYALLRAGIASVVRHLGTCRLRAAKAPSPLLDRFGWCTADAFPDQPLSAARLEAGLVSFARGGVTPRFVLLDDGWLTVQATEPGAERLASFAAHDGFPEGLAGAVAMSRRLGSERFYAWHPLPGYWGGIVAAAFPAYRTREVTPVFGDGVLHFRPDLAAVAACGLVEPADLWRFFDDFYRELRAAGVDGVSVAQQDVLEAVAAGRGGRARLLREGRQAVEAAARTHFAGELRNSMSLANDALYTLADSSLTRTGADFSAAQPESHGRLLYANAQAALFLGELVQPDWGAFKSGHPAGAFHAAARILSGGPVYVNDGPGEQNFELLRQLVLSDGTVLRPEEPARPTRDCLVADPCREEVLLKLFSHNRCNSVVGAFNCQYHEAEPRRHFVAGSIAPLDVEDLPGNDFALYLQQRQKLVRGRRQSRISLWLGELGWELVTIVPVVEGLAPIGLVERLNGGAAVTAIRHAGNESEIDLREGGQFVAWCDCEPLSAIAGDVRWPFAYERQTKLLRVRIGTRGPTTLRLTIDRDGRAADNVRRTGRWRAGSLLPPPRGYPGDGPAAGGVTSCG